MKLAVQFGDLDMYSRLSMKGALRLMQEACNCHSEQAGYGINDIERNGVCWMLHQQRVRLYRRPCWNTQLTVQTWSRGADGLICLRDFEMTDAGGAVVAQASSGWLLVNTATQRLEQPSGELLAGYGYDGRAVFEEPLRRLRALPEAKKSWEYTVLRRDIDINHHVNNLCYLDYAWESLPKEYSEEDFDEADILYKKAARLGDRLTAFSGWLPEETGDAGDGAKEENGGPTYVTAIKNETGRLLHAVVYLTRGR